MSRKKRSLIRRIAEFTPQWLKNRYSLTAIMFVVWMVFFDSNHLVSQFELRHELKELREQETFYRERITENTRMTQELVTNPGTLERFAREKYLMKREGEDLYVVDR